MKKKQPKSLRDDPEQSKLFIEKAREIEGDEKRSAAGKLMERLAKMPPAGPEVKHKDIDYGVEEDRPGLWRWIIYPKIENGPKVVGPAIFTRREAAVAACIEAINNNLERLRLRKPPH
jgi:hypothetical protein